MSSSISYSIGGPKAPAKMSDMTPRVEKNWYACCLCCKKGKKLRQFHERALTQDEIDYTNVLKVDKAAKKAFEEKK